MKNILKLLLIFVLGLVAGAGTMGFVLNKIHQKQLAQIFAMDVGASAMLAQFLREGMAELVIESKERHLVDGIVAIHGNDDLKDSMSAETSLRAAKRYYVCTKTEIPPEIADILKDVAEFPCPNDEQ